jgi:hypothetical protein
LLVCRQLPDGRGDSRVVLSVCSNSGIAIGEWV